MGLIISSLGCCAGRAAVKDGLCMMAWGGGDASKGEWSMGQPGRGGKWEWLAPEGWCSVMPFDRATSQWNHVQVRQPMG